MCVKMLRVGLATFLLLFGCAAGIRAQVSIPPEKRELIKELLGLIGGTKNIDAMLDAMMRQSEEEVPKLVTQVNSSGAKRTPEEQAALEKESKEIAVRLNKRLREFFQKMNFAQAVDDLAASTFDKYFTESELKELIAFYKSPAGRKTIELMPVLLTELMTKMNETLVPRIQEEIDKIVADELNILEEKLKAVESKMDAGAAELERLIVPIEVEPATTLPPVKAKKRKRRH
jgi:uncharacterized protein